MAAALENPATTAEVAMPPPLPPDSRESSDSDSTEGVRNDAESMRETIMAATMRYFQAKAAYPDRADEAMRKELQGFLNLKFFKGVRVKDIPKEERKYILSSLDSVRSKVDGDGVFVKDKARVFANGSKEKDEDIFMSSSPVARIQSVNTVATYGAFCKARMFTVDVVQAYPNTPRPGYVRHRVIRLSKEVAADGTRIQAILGG
jgi:hypothetical protein